MPQSALTADVTLDQRLTSGLVTDGKIENCRQLLVIEDSLQQHCIFDVAQKIYDASHHDCEFGIILLSHLAPALPAVGRNVDIPLQIIFLRAYNFDGPVFCEGTEINDTLTSLAGLHELPFLTPPMQPLPEVMENASALTIGIPNAITEQENIELSAGLQAVLIHGITQCSHPVTVLNNPILLTADYDASLAFSSKPVFGANITFNNALKNQPFRFLPTGEILGWTDYSGLQHLTVIGDNPAPLNTFLDASDNAIRTTRPMMLLWLNTPQEQQHAWVACFIDATSVTTSTAG